jgi:hypothetical protein
MNTRRSFLSKGALLVGLPVLVPGLLKSEQATPNVPITETKKVDSATLRKEDICPIHLRTNIVIKNLGINAIDRIIAIAPISIGTKFLKKYGIDGVINFETKYKEFVCGGTDSDVTTSTYSQLSNSSTCELACIKMRVPENNISQFDERLNFVDGDNTSIYLPCAWTGLVSPLRNEVAFPMVSDGRGKLFNEEKFMFFRLKAQSNIELVFYYI